MVFAALAQVPLLTSYFWQVDRAVDEPYLDELFHVRQAQQYCNGNFGAWDPKITTPPGLYLLSYVLSSTLGCKLSNLRNHSAACLDLITLLIAWLYAVRTSKFAGPDHGTRLMSEHSAFNLTLFPPLFFFSALYYTDVPSTLSVLTFHIYFMQSLGDRRWFNPLLLVALGSISLLFRQTNLFWVAVFPAGITLVQALDQGHVFVKDSMYRRVEGFGDSLPSVMKTCWKTEVIYDPPVRDAFVDDYVKTILSTAVCALKAATRLSRISRLLLTLSPYLTLITLFAGFVLWNGGIVLGDKSNHIATLHLPQMLYIWPYMTFFSWPMLYQYLMLLPLTVFAKQTSVSHLEQMLMFRRRYFLPRMWLVVMWTVLACAVVHFNTVVHPFTLADNRHYTFYVFRLLMRPWWVRYAVTPLYVLCGWACIQALGSAPASVAATANKHVSDQQRSAAHTKLPLPDTRQSATTSFVLVWLAATALQLITAPLVEPRYLILPWMFWRMHLPMTRSQSRGQEAAPNERFWVKAKRALLDRHDHRLWPETVWFLAVNAATAYIFLTWTFEWPQEPGRMQRFMW